jgi:hypothetical protein
MIKLRIMSDDPGCLIVEALNQLGSLPGMFKLNNFILHTVLFEKIACAFGVRAVVLVRQMAKSYLAHHAISIGYFDVAASSARQSRQ